MDWSKAKTYLILTFLLLDLVLGYQYWNMRTEQAGYVQSFPEQLAEVRELLSAQKWEIRTDVPKLTPELGFLHVRFVDLPLEDWKKRVTDSDKLTFRGPGQVTFELTDKNIDTNLSEEGLGERLWPQLASLVLQKEMYKYDRTLEIGKGFGLVKYLQTQNGYPIFSSAVEVLIQSNKVTRLNQTALEVIREEGSKKQVISAVHALRSLSESIDKSEKSPDNKVILDLRLGYYSKMYNADEWYLTPVWRIVTDQEAYFVNALTGEVELDR